MAKKKNQEQIVNLSKKSKQTNELSKGCRDITQLLSPSSIIYTSENELKVENNIARSYVVNAYPPQVYLGWLDDLYSYRGDNDVAVNIEPISERIALDEITREITKYQTQLMIESENGNISNIQMLRDKVEALVNQRASLQRNQERLFSVTTTTCLYGTDVKSLNKSAQILQNRFAGKYVGLMPLYLRQDDGFKSTSPFGYNAVPDYARNMNTGALATMFPFYNPNMTNSKGVFLGIDDITETPVVIDFFDKTEYPNANAFISGVSGFGKSFLLSLINMRSALEGIRTAIIDAEGEMEKSVLACGGTVIKLGQGSDAMINIMDIDEEVELDTNGNPTGRVYVDIKGKVAELLSFFGVLIPEYIADSTFKSIFSDILATLYYQFGFSEDVNSLYENSSSFNKETGEYRQNKVLKTMPRLSDIKQALYNYGVSTNNNYFINCANTLLMYCEGGIYDLFDCYTNIQADMKKVPLISFDVSKAEEGTIRPIAMQVALSWCWSKFIKNDLNTKKRIVVDEAWLLLKENLVGSNYTAFFLENTARRIRKYNGSLLCASQNFKEFTHRPEGLAVLNNSIVKIFLRQSDQDIEAIGSNFLLTAGELDFVSTAQRGRALIKVGKNSSTVSVTAFDFEKELIEKAYLKG